MNIDQTSYYEIVAKVINLGTRITGEYYVFNCINLINDIRLIPDQREILLNGVKKITRSARDNEFMGLFM